MIRKLIYKLGVLIWNDKLPKHYRYLKSSENKSLEQLRNEQLEKLKKLLMWAYENSIYYRELYSQNNFKPEDLVSLDDLWKIPVIRKVDLLNNVEKIQIKEGLGKLIYSETSGSTGQSLKFYRTKDWDASTRAAMYRGYSWYGVNPWEKNGYLWGFNLRYKFKIRVLDSLQNRFRLFSYDTDSIKKFSEKLKSAVFLEGYSSMIYETAKIINEYNFIKRPKLKLVKGTSEKIFDYYHRESIKAFGKKIVSEYGSAESGVIAFECPFGSNHVTMENVIAEEIDNEIVVTNLWSFSFPVIRYRLGDYISFKHGHICKCGLQHEIIDGVTGRIGALIQGKNKTYPSLVLYYIFKNLALQENLILRYQAIQNEKGKVVFRIENILSAVDVTKVMNEAYKYFEEDISCEVLPDSPPLRDNGKIKDFITRIANPYYSCS